MTIPLTLIAIALLTGLCVFGSWRLSKPADPLNPRLAPWRTILVFAGFGVVIFLVHLLRLLGFEGVGAG